MSRSVAGSMRLFHAEVAAVYEWWCHELRDVWDDVIAHYFPQRVSRAVLDLSADSCTLTICRGRSRESESATLQDISQIGYAISELKTKLPSGARIDVNLPSSRVLRHRLVLPTAVESNLDRAIELQLARYMPMPVDELRMDWHIEDRIQGGSRLVIALAAVRGAEIEAILSALSGAGLRVASIGCAEPGEKFRFDFLPSQIGKSRRVLAPRDRHLFWSAHLCAMVWLSLTAGQIVYERVRIQKVVDQEREQAVEAQRLISEVARKQKPLDSLQNLLKEPSASEVLAALTGAVPRNSWVYHLELSTSRPNQGAFILISAMSPRPTELVDTLEKTVEFDNARLITASSAGIGTGADRAEISLSAAPNFASLVFSQRLP